MTRVCEDALEPIEWSWIENYLEQIDFINGQFKIYRLTLKISKRWRLAAYQPYHRRSLSSYSASLSASDSATSSDEDKEDRRLQQ
jgi:hypothetical protein